MRFILIVYLCLLVFPASASYIFDNQNGQVLSDRPYFDVAFIKSHGIRKIKGHFLTKASMDIIRETNQVYTYEFDRLGQLIREYQIKNNDTIITLYTYDADGHITYIMNSFRAGFITEHFIYDKLGRIILKETRREVNKKTSNLEFEAAESYEISSEKYEYIDLGSGNYKMLYYNKMGKVYKEEFFFLNEEKLLKKQETRMVIGSARKEILYLYDQKNRLTEIKSESWIMGHTKENKKFEYDEEGKVMAMHYYKNDHYETEYQILYDEQTHFVKSVISRNAANDFITILKFTEYSFYSNH